MRDGLVFIVKGQVTGTPGGRCQSGRQHVG